MFVPVFLATEIGWLDKISDAIKSAISWVINLLPASPFQAISNSGISDVAAGLNWIFPISEILAIMQTWLVAIGLFYAYQVILRWIKAIE